MVIRVIYPPDIRAHGDRSAETCGPLPTLGFIKVSATAPKLHYLGNLRLTLTILTASTSMSEWVVLDITSMTKTTKSDKVIKILKEVWKNDLIFIIAIALTMKVIRFKI